MTCPSLRLGGLFVALLVAACSGGSSCPGDLDASFLADARETHATDAPALADAMATLLKDRARAGALGEQARRRAEDCYSIESIARRIEGIYRAELAAALGGR